MIRGSFHEFIIRRTFKHGFGDRAIFEDISFRLNRGEHIGLVGANGEGKSTFMNIVTNHMEPDEGSIQWTRGIEAGYLDQHTILTPVFQSAAFSRRPLIL
jgi:ATPase subunit of ABC transporter with duplicated ATPase domains